MARAASAGSSSTRMAGNRLPTRSRSSHSFSVMDRGGVKAANTQSPCLLHRAMASSSMARGSPLLTMNRWQPWALRRSRASSMLSNSITGRAP